MKREIKFRGKSLDNGEWKYGSLLSIEDTCFIIEDGDFDFNYITEDHAFWFDCTEKEVNPDTVGQYTGLKDRDGKEIWEGDIVMVDYRDEDYPSPTFPFVVMFSDGAFCFAEDEESPWGTICDIDILEVVGNVHDNFDLLPCIKNESDN